MSLRDFFLKKEDEEREELVVEQKKAPTTSFNTPSQRYAEPTNLFIMPSNPVFTTTNEYESHFDQLKTDGDYINFLSSINEMNSLGFSEHQKFIAAFSSFKKFGVTTSKLISSAEEYSQLVEKENEEFQESLTQSISEDITAKEQSILEAQQQIAELTAKVQQWQNEVFQNKGKLDNAARNFKSSYERRSQDIKNNIEKIKLYLNGTSK